MFELPVYKCSKKPPHKMPHDISLPSGTVPGSYQHVGKSPCTNHLYHAFETRVKRDEEEKIREEEESKTYQKNYVSMMMHNHVEKKRIQRKVREKVEQKIQDYEDSVNKRREKLQKLLYTEERQFYHETVEMAQKGDERRMEEMKRTVERIRAKREEERLQLVKEKKLEQYLNRCQDYRPALLKKHLIESKNAQLQQMRENEAKREANRELDRMWYQLNQKEMQAKIDREERELLSAKAQQLALYDILQQQIRGKELLKEQEKKLTMEDRIEIQKYTEKLRLDELEELKKKGMGTGSLREELLKQMRTQRCMLEKRRREEEDIDRTFALANQMELERELAKSEEFASQMKKETAMYKEHLKELEAERKKENEELDLLLEQHRQEVQKKQDEEKCKVIAAKRALQCEVLKGRAEQLEHKRKDAENQLKLKQAENELLRLAFETNACLQAESDRLEREATKQYRDDLKKQIDYNNLLRERERQELERQMQKGREEEESYQKLIQEIIAEEAERSEKKHPFRQVLEKYDCRCPVPPF